jgi:dTDP-4-amino-4,6-dideoxygalactose transaminase
MLASLPAAIVAYTLPSSGFTAPAAAGISGRRAEVRALRMDADAEVLSGMVTPSTAAPPKFTKDFSKPMSIPEEGIEAAVEVMRSGRLFRYCATDSQAAAAEKEFAEMVDQKYALGVNSCSSAIMLALMVIGVKPGDKVITNGFTFTALPSTIMRLGAEPVLVEATPYWTMDLDDLEAKAAAEPDATVLLLSHMRGKVCDMDRVVEICKKHNLRLVEDCAHSCGVKWRGRQLGYHAEVTAYSTQSDKVINSGEGGFLTTDDDEMMAKAIYLSGAYEKRYTKHATQPPAELCEAAMLEMPNLSVRMSELTAAVARPLIRNLPERVEQYNRRYDSVVSVLRAEAAGTIVVPDQLPQVSGVGDHLNFYLSGVSAEQNAKFLDTCTKMGVPVSWFRSKINARYHVNWRKYGAPSYELPAVDALLANAYDLKMPPYFDDADFVHLAKVISYAANVAVGRVGEPKLKMR